MGDYPLVAIKIKQYGELKMKIEVILTGTRYYNGFPCLDLGGEVRIEFDEENEYSDNAFGVFTLGGLRIGSVAENPLYIPRGFRRCRRRKGESLNRREAAAIVCFSSRESGD